MALTLTDALAAPTASAPALSLEVTGTVPDAIDIGYRFRLGDEVLELRSFFRTTAATFGGTTTENVRDANSWEVARALAGTAAVSHNSGTAVLGVTDALVAGDDEDLPEPFATDGGGTSDHTALTNLDTADQHPIAAVEGLEDALAALDPVVTNTRTLTATTQGTDTDATILGNFLTSDVGSRIAGPLTEEIYGGTTIISVVEGVSAEMSSMAAAPGVDIIVRVSEPIPVVTGTGRVWIVHDTDLASDLAFSIRNVLDDGWVTIGPGYFDGDGAYIARVMPSGLALEVVTLNRDGSVPTIAAGFVLSNNRIGFFNTDPVVRPEVPANPTPQDIADTLVALGLITQAV